MSEHTVTITWHREGDDFSYKNFSRTHQWDFGHDNTVTASAAPDYRGNPNQVDPEQAFVAALASCHMLTFLAIASQKQYVVDQYEDNAVGLLTKNREGKMALTEVTLRPHVTFGGDNKPNAEAVEQLHQSAHRNCFLANSVKTHIHVEPQ